MMAYEEVTDEEAGMVLTMATDINTGILILRTPEHKRYAELVSSGRSASGWHENVWRCPDGRKFMTRRWVNTTVRGAALTRRPA